MKEVDTQLKYTRDTTTIENIQLTNNRNIYLKKQEQTKYKRGREEEYNSLINNELQSN